MAYGSRTQKGWSNGIGFDWAGYGLNGIGPRLDGWIWVQSRLDDWVWGLAMWIQV